MNTESIEHGFSSSNPRVAGILIAIASALSVILMTHHPSVSSHAIGDIVDEIANKAMISRVVHGALITLIGALIYAFIEFSCRLGLNRASVRAGLVAYAIGSGAMIGAALVSGFLISGLALGYAHGPSDEFDGMRYMLKLCSLANQTLANFGVVAISAAIILWSAALLSRSRGIALIGILGLIVGAGPVIALSLEIIKLDVFGMTIVVVCQTLWNLAVGVALVRGRI